MKNKQVLKKLQKPILLKKHVAKRLQAKQNV